MPECAVEFDRYFECINKYSNEASKLFWCRKVLRELDKCMLNDKNPLSKKVNVNYVLNDIPPYIN